jgi:hypothetical protein
MATARALSASTPSHTLHPSGSFIAIVQATETHPLRARPPGCGHRPLIRIGACDHRKAATQTISEYSIANSTAQSTGLPTSAITAIQQVLATHPEVAAAILYGSRVLGRHRPASDIDLSLIGARLNAAALLEHVARAGQVLYRRADSQP